METNKIRSSASSPSKKPKSLSEPRFGNLGTCVYVDFFLFLLHVLRLFFFLKINDVLFRNPILITIVVIEKSRFNFLDLKTHFPTSFSHENT